MSEKRLNEELAAVEAALASLTPVPSTIQRDQLLFLAGQAAAASVASRRRRRFAAWLWPCATSASLLVAAGFGALWAAGRTPQIVERVVYVKVEKQPAAVASAASARSSAPFADWRPAFTTRHGGAATPPQPRSAPVHRTPGRSDQGGYSRSTRSVS
jgi:hypothetical protein